MFTTRTILAHVIMNLNTNFKLVIIESGFFDPNHIYFELIKRDCPINRTSPVCMYY